MQGKDLLNRTLKALTFPVEENADMLVYNKIKTSVYQKAPLNKPFSIKGHTMSQNENRHFQYTEPKETQTLRSRINK